MKQSEMTAVEIGGYRRYIQKDKLEQVQAEAKMLIEQYVKIGIPREQAEEAYKVTMVRDT